MGACSAPPPSCEALCYGGEWLALPPVTSLQGRFSEGAAPELTPREEALLGSLRVLLAACGAGYQLEWFWVSAPPRGALFSEFLFLSANGRVLWRQPAERLESRVYVLSEGGSRPRHAAWAAGERAKSFSLLTASPRCLRWLAPPAAFLHWAAVPESLAAVAQRRRWWPVEPDSMVRAVADRPAVGGVWVHVAPPLSRAGQCAPLVFHADTPIPEVKRTLQHQWGRYAPVALPGTDRLLWLDGPLSLLLEEPEKPALLPERPALLDEDAHPAP